MRVRRTFVAITLAATLGPPASGSPGAPAGEDQPTAPEEAKTRVLVISVDGLIPGALRQLGSEGAPHFHRLMREGAVTLNAHTQVELTTTLPNHMSMVTGRRIARRHDGHGVTWNEHISGTTVQKAAGHDVGSIFSVLNKAGMNSALFAAKQKFSLFDRSWPGINRVTIKDGKDGALVKAATSDLIQRSRAFTFLHFGAPDKAGHAHGFMSEAYLGAVRRTDARLGGILAAVDSHPSLERLTIVLASDHGGRRHGHSHSDQTRLANYRVPFMVWGPGVTHDNLYDLNPAFKDPGRRRIRFVGKQPIRNGDIANFSTYLLGLGPVPDSLWNHHQRLRAG